jgi:hypothetical protein
MARSKIINLLSASLIVAGSVSACTASRVSKEVAHVSQAATSSLDEQYLYYEIVGARPGLEHFWRVESSGKGWLKVPARVGFELPKEADSAHRYLFRGGFHTFDIGPDGYRRLFLNFAGVIDDTDGGHGLINSDLQCLREKRDLASGMLAWTHPSSGKYAVPFACLTPKGAAVRAKADTAWRLIARLMVERDQFGAVDEGAGVPEETAPLTIDGFQKFAWSGLEIRWLIEPNGKGWLETSDDFFAFRTNAKHIPRGRFDFDIGQEGYRTVRSNLNPYISGPERLSECIGLMEDQPVTKISWAGVGGISGSYRNDLGCLSYADRVDRTFQLIANAAVNVQ